MRGRTEPPSHTALPNTCRSQRQELRSSRTRESAALPGGRARAYSESLSLISWPHTSKIQGDREMRTCRHSLLIQHTSSAASRPPKGVRQKCRGQVVSAGRALARLRSAQPDEELAVRDAFNPERGLARGGTRDRTSPDTGKPTARSDPSGADSATRRTRATCQLPKMILVTTNLTCTPLRTASIRMSVPSPNITMKPEPRPSLLHRNPDATDAAPLRRQRPQRPCRPHLRPHHAGPAVTRAIPG